MPEKFNIHAKANLGAEASVAPEGMPQGSPENAPEEPPVQLDERQEAVKTAHMGIVNELGKYPRDLKGGGAHYVPTVDEKAQINGIMCKSCVFFNTLEKSCEIVEGTINDTGVCRYWVIPESKLTMSSEVKKSRLPMRRPKPKG